jgi:hypothetical protein
VTNRTGDEEEVAVVLELGRPRDLKSLRQNFVVDVLAFDGDAYSKIFLSRYILVASTYVWIMLF